MAGIVVKARARILHGHDWVFSSEVLKVFGDPDDGDVISLKDGKDHLIGSAIYNSKSQIIARRFSRQRQELDLDFFKRRIAQAMDYRVRREVDQKLCRVVWSDSDGLPGVIIDRYGDHFVLQTLTLAMDMRKDLIANAIVDLLRAQKTGFYLDQKQNYGIIAQHARDRRVLDCFANEGAFALSCARAGAADVAAVEESGASVLAGKRHAAQNGLRMRWMEEDAFQFLRAAEEAQAQYDLIVLDPPSFTKTRSGLRDALRGYRELHLRVFKLLPKDGLLATFSCSHHVSEAAFEQTIVDALVDARRSARKLRRFEQAPDHPVLPTLPETEYFKGLLLEMMPGR